MMSGAILTVAMSVAMTEEVHQRASEEKEIRQSGHDMARVRREKIDAKSGQGEAHGQPQS